MEYLVSPEMMEPMVVLESPDHLERLAGMVAMELTELPECLVFLDLPVFPVSLDQKENPA